MSGDDGVRQTHPTPEYPPPGGRYSAAAGAHQSSRTRDIDAVADAVRSLHAEGLSQSETARRLGIDRPQLSRWSKRTGLLWAVPPIAAERQAERIKQGRRDLAEASLADALALRALLWPEGGDQPDARAVRDVAAAMASLVAAHLHLDTAVADAATVGAKSMLSRLQAEIEQGVAEIYGGQDPTGPTEPTPTASTRGDY